MKRMWTWNLCSNNSSNSSEEWLIIMIIIITTTTGITIIIRIIIAWKVSKYGVISGPNFPVFGLNTEKYGPEITPYLDIFHAVNVIMIIMRVTVMISTTA